MHLIFVLLLFFVCTNDVKAREDLIAKSSLANNRDISLFSKDNCDAKSYIDKLISQVSGINKYIFEYKMTVFKHKSSESETGTFYFMKPRYLKIIQTSGKRNGSVAVLANSKKVEAHAGGFIKFVKVTLDQYDDDLKTLNGTYMVDSDWLSLYESLKSYVNSGMICKVTSSPILISQFSKNFTMLDVYKSNILYKRILINPNTLLPEYWFDFTNGKLSSFSQFYNINLNPNISLATFKL